MSFHIFLCPSTSFYVLICPSLSFSAAFCPSLSSCASFSLSVLLCTSLPFYVLYPSLCASLHLSVLYPFLCASLPLSILYPSLCICLSPSHCSMFVLCPLCPVFYVILRPYALLFYCFPISNFKSQLRSPVFIALCLSPCQRAALKLIY